MPKPIQNVINKSANMVFIGGVVATMRIGAR